MDITPELVKKIATQARLNLSDAEIKQFVPQLKEILQNFSELDKVDTKNVQPSFHPIEIKNVSREDVVGECLNQDDALSSTPHKRNGYFRGPKTL